MIRFILIPLSFILAFSSPAFSQKEVRQELRKGNKDYKREKYDEAEIAYRKALEVNPRSTDAAYNLGNTLYKQSKFPQAMQQYEAALSREKDQGMAAADFHNVGNIFMSSQDYQKSIEAYKKSLRLNPNDDETRYNLALAQKLLENQQNQGQGNDKDKDKQDQNKDDQKQDQQKQDDQKQQQQDKKDQQQQQNPNEMQKENAEQILDAMMQDERNTQEKVKAQQIRQQKQRKTEKNW